MSLMTLNHDNTNSDITYGIYTIERLPKGSKRTPKWDLHSMAKDKKTAETHAKTLSLQPYFDRIEVQEFRLCPQTRERTVHKIRTYSRQSSKFWVVALAILGCVLFGLFAFS